eukprot:SAG31_NODE_8543_length_1432_cov_5.499020_2_plen_46_part_01
MIKIDQLSLQRSRSREGSVAPVSEQVVDALQEDLLQQACRFEIPRR